MIKMNRSSIRWVIVLGWCLSFVAAFSSAALSQPCPQWIGKMVSVQGTVEARKAGDNRWLPVNLNDTFCPGDTIRVGSKSRADLTLSNQSVLRLDENSEFTLEGIKEGNAASLNMLKGAAHFFSRTPRGLEVQTPYTIAGVRGTEFMLRIEEGRTLLTVFEGAVLAQNTAGSLTLQGGQSAVAEAGKAPALRTVARPRDAVQWALYYPPVIYTASGASALPANDPRGYAQQASQLLSVGRVDEASAEIERALRLDPNAGDALALQTIILVVQNQKDMALTTAQRAVNAAPTSASARIALSYAQQARFDLDAARASLEEAVKLDPANALAWARLSEMHMSFGDLDKALETAKRAVAADPNLSRTQTVLGFAHLAQVDTQQAREAFDKAIAFDQADPLPRLGMGLAIIRDGNLEDGGRQIEIAASLDPNNSITRSYLGKTYYEEKRTGLDQREYATAKELDPNDPTPYFYDAIAKQTTNRPVEALQDYQKAIELNDNRAVYRSRLLLDSDEAARSAALARIYNDLGFQQRALAEGWSALNSDPASYSAHRFLADSYSILPRREIARVSELLQSQLLQPINITPIQPRLGESSLFLISSQGPATFSFNEFNPIFNRNRVALQGSGLAGENNTYSGEGVVSGIHNKLSFSAGYSYFDTDGWNKNADQTDKIANVFMQYEFNPKTSIQAEYRYRDKETGDILQYYWKDNRRPYKADEEKNNRIRFGLRHEFSPNSILLGNFQYSNADAHGSDLLPLDNAGFGLPPPPVQDFSTYDEDKYNAYSSELSHLFRSQHFDVVGGAGYFNIDQRIDFSDNLIWPGPPPIDFGTFDSRLDSDTNHYNVYLYSHIKPVKRLIFTVGASGDLYDSNDKDDELDLDRNKFNPKFGVTVYPFVDTAIRGAVFKTFKRTLITDQTLEPTQVAGFNQFFDDVDATEAWAYGLGLDQKFSKSVYAGAEFVYRDLSVPYLTLTDFGNLTYADAPWEEYLGRAYVNWAPHDWLAFRLEYGYEKLECTDQVNLGAIRVDTHSVPFGVNFFHPSGFFAGLKATWYYQKGRFTEFDTLDVKNADNSFWLADAVVGYRMPNRYGFITAGVTNLFDKEGFNYWETDTKNSRIQPDRQAFITVTLALP
jgi:tetratricopeptide (TPR) repeat protein